jgi:sec-independent protein translocase protein TatC
MTEQVDQNEMSIWQHAIELRGRLLKAMAALVVTVSISLFALGQPAVEILAQPAGGIDKLRAFDPTESFSVFMRISLLAGFIMALPVIVYQILAFVLPGLYENERRWIYLAVPIATLLFVSGVAFSYFVMLPVALPFLFNFMVKTVPRVSSYVDFVTNLMFWIGLSFEMPLVVFILAKLHIVTPKMLIGYWRYAIVIIALMAAIITPTTDPVNMALFMAPLFLLYLLSILFAYFA